MILGDFNNMSNLYLIMTDITSDTMIKTVCTDKKNAKVHI